MSGQDNHDTSSRTRAKIHSVFKRVWDEYYAWDALSTKKLLSLKTQNTQATRPANFHLPTLTPATENSLSSLCLEDIAGSSHSHSVDDTNSFTLYQLHDDGSLAVEEVATTGAEMITLTEFSPCPAYEACTLMPENILHGDDPNDMPFIPFADDFNFDAVEHCKEYDRFAWQVTNVDPDCESSVLTPTGTQ